MRTGRATRTFAGAIAAAMVAVAACLFVSAPQLAWADADSQADQAAEFVSFKSEGSAVFSGALSELKALIDYGKAYRSREEARYWDEASDVRAERREQWERAQAWRDRFPLGDYSDVLFIGDSIMDEARWHMAEIMPGCEINADSGRTLEEGGLIREDAKPEYGVLDHVRSDDGMHVRYVIGTGNNDAGGVPLSAAEEIIALLGPDKEIYFVTEMVTGNPWGTANTNATIDAVVAEYPNVHKIDWHGFVEGREHELLRDVCHPTEYGKPLFAQVLKAGLDVCYAQ